MKPAAPPATPLPLSTTRDRIVRHVLGAAAAACAALLVLGLVQAPASAAEPGPARFTPPQPPQVKPVPVTAVKPAMPRHWPMMPDGTDKPAPVWPAAGTAVVQTPPSRAGALSTTGPERVKAGALPVHIARPGTGLAATAAHRADARSAEVPTRVRVQLFDRSTTDKAGVTGLLLRVGRGDAAVDAAAVDVTVDYRAFRTAYGGDWASRLRLLRLPECALSTPQRRECAGTPLPSRNMPAAGTVQATVLVPASRPAKPDTGAAATGTAASTLLAVSAAPSGPAGSYAATSLQPSATWTAGGNSGNFTWSYPMRVPPPPGGPAPSVGLGYSAQSVDGRHAASNNQPSSIGEGFDSTAGGFIERSYEACADDMSEDGEPGANNTEKTGDLCWATDNATLSLAGHAGELIFNSAQNRWHLRGDDGSRVERKTGADNGDNNGEYWVVTTTDGVQYWFGAHKLPGWTSGKPVTDSVWTVPVFGNHAGEPCHASAFAASSCAQAWRWNLDYVVDLDGNSASYWYVKETNWYARNKDADNLASYVRAGQLDHIAYATRREAGVDSVFQSSAPALVDFGTANRCLSDCGTHGEAQWPDTPWDQRCTENQSGCANYSPTFWATKRLSTVTTRIRNGSSYDDVERWTLTHTFPDPGDGTRAGLWLSKLSHSGLVGSAKSVPDIEFGGIQLSNRVDTIDFAAAMNWWRVDNIRYETGGTVSVLYSNKECVARSNVPTQPATNTLRCYPVRWTPEGYANPVTDYFHKYVVTTVYEADNTSGVVPNGSPRTVTTYTYLGDPAWHYADDDGLIEKKDKTWSVWRGYATVGTTTGDAGEQTYTEAKYFRGMHGDRAASGTRTVTVTGAGVPTVNDEDAYAGMVRQTTVFNGPGGAIVSQQVYEPWRSAVTATRTINNDTVEARFTGNLATHERVTRDGGRSTRVRTIRNTFEAYGQITAIDDSGDTTVAGDEQCTQTTYEPRNTDVWLITPPHRVRSFGVSCQTAANAAALTDDEVISDKRSYYDGHGYGVAPDRGHVTKSEEADAWNQGSPTYQQVSRAAYDTQGRITTAWNALDKESSTTYTPASGGLVTQTEGKNPLGHITTTTVHPAWGLPTAVVDANGKRTDMAYDGLGRLTAVWRPGRVKGTHDADTTYSYLIRNTAPSAVGTSTVNAAGNYVTSYTLYDGLLRTRQTQVPSATSGRLLTDAYYDTAGRQVRQHAAYAAAGTPGVDLHTATAPQHVPNQTRTVYDGAGRVTGTIFQPNTTERWRTSTAYGGDRVDITPPDGGTPTSTVYDALGRTIAIRQYRAATPTGDHDTTTYTYNRKGKLERFTDPAGNHWDFTYDLRGRQRTASDPDKGTTTNNYDGAGRLASTSDARNVTLTYTYDDLNRRTAIQQPGVGTRARWTYDTVAKGQLTQSIRYVGAASYTRRVTGYNNAYQPTGLSIMIPAAETGLAGTYTTETTYNVDGTLDTQTYPSTGDLPLEALQYRYDPVTGLPTQLVSTYNGSSTSYVARTDYDALGRVGQYVFHTGLFSELGARLYQTFTRELDTGRLTGMLTKRESVAPYNIRDARYTFDDAGNITEITDVAVGDNQCFRYDHLRRLTEAWTPAAEPCAATASTAGLGGPAPYWQSWTYDAIGNRQTQVDHPTATGAAPRTTDYAYPATGAARPHALTGTTTTVGSTTSSATYTYDPTGNTLTRPSGSAGTQTLAWDPEGSLAASTDNTGATSYIYDADGNRLIRRDPTGKTLYLPGQELRYATTGGAKTATRYYAFRDTTVASRTAGGLTWLSADHQGTDLVAIDESSQQARIRRNTPFGESRGTQPTSWPNTRGFVGGTADNTGLTHLGAREYDPAAGRFISVDPIQDLTDPQQWNGYNYANNSPVTQSDPDGRRPTIGDGGADDSHILAQSGETLTYRTGRWTVEKGGRGTWMNYYLNNVKHKTDPEKLDLRWGADVKDTTLFGSGTVYDKDGNVVAADNNFRSGGGYLPELGETEKDTRAREVEQRVIRWFEDAGVLKPGSTLYIRVNKEGRTSCNRCSGFMTEAAERLGIRIIYEAPGLEPVPYGKTNSDAKLKAPPVSPARPIKPVQEPLPGMPEPGKSKVRPRGPSGGGGTPRGLGGAATGVGGAAGVVGFISDIYFYQKYGPCALDVTGSVCEYGDPELIRQRYIA